MGTYLKCLAKVLLMSSPVFVELKYENNQDILVKKSTLKGDKFCAHMKNRCSNYRCAGENIYPLYHISTSFFVTQYFSRTRTNIFLKII